MGGVLGICHPTFSRIAITIVGSMYFFSWTCYTNGIKISACHDLLLSYSFRVKLTVVLSYSKGTIKTAEKVSLSTTTLYEIKAPKIGQWSLQISPSVITGKYTFDVKSTSDAIVDFSHYFLVTIQRPRSDVKVFTSNPVIGELLSK